MNAEARAEGEGHLRARAGDRRAEASARAQHTSDETAFFFRNFFIPEDSLPSTSAVADWSASAVSVNLEKALSDTLSHESREPRQRRVETEYDTALTERTIALARARGHLALAAALTAFGRSRRPQTT